MELPSAGAGEAGASGLEFDLSKFTKKTEEIETRLKKVIAEVEEARQKVESQKDESGNFITGADPKFMIACQQKMDEASRIHQELTDHFNTFSEYLKRDQAQLSQHIKNMTT